MKPKRGSRIATIILILLIAAGVTGIFFTLRGGEKSGISEGRQMRPGSGMPGNAQGPPGSEGQGGRESQGRPGEKASGLSAAGDSTVQSVDSSGTAVRVITLGTGTVRRYVKTSGDVLAESEVDIYSDVAGHIVRYLVEEGDTMRQNEVIATVDPSRPGETYSASPVTATISGTITSVPLVKGDSVTTQTPIAVISDLTKLKIETSVPERYVGKLHKGLGADIELKAFPGEVFHAAVSALGSTLDTASRTLRVELELVPTDWRIKAGMFADIRIYIEQKTGIPVLPREALTGSIDQRSVFVAGPDDTAERREIVLGLEGEEFLEVVSGVETGEKVIVRGQSYLSDGDPIRIIE